MTDRNAAAADVVSRSSMAEVRKCRMVFLEMRCRSILNVSWIAEWAETKRWAGSWDLMRCIFRSRRRSANLAGYYQWHSDIQRNVSVLRGGVVANITENAAKAYIYGGELELRLTDGDLIDLGFNYAYVKPGYDSLLTLSSVYGVPNLLISVES